MKIQLLHPNAIMPKRSTEHAAGFDIYMPEEGGIPPGEIVQIPLGFATEIPEGYVAILNPRSGTGFTFGLELNNTNGWIDADFRGEWQAKLRTKDGKGFYWKQGQRILQFVIVPCLTPKLTQVDSLADSQRGTGGLGSTGK